MVGLGVVEGVSLHGERPVVAAGSMEPKIRACLEFLEAGGQEAVITTPQLLKAALRGKAGTRIHRDRFD